MPLSWNEIRNRAYAFVNEWQEECREHAESKSFWDAFFHVFGISRRRVASFEAHVKKIDGKDGFIDLLWKGTLLIEHKSKGKDLDRAHRQATGYFSGLTDNELPKYILVSDFERFRLYDLDQGGEIIAEFTIGEFPANIKQFAFMAGYTTTEIKPEDPVNIEAADKMGKLHDALSETGYAGHDLEIYLVRLLFCLFAEDTGIFERNLFKDFIQLHTHEDGSDLSSQLNYLFQILNTPHKKRLKNLPEQLASFEYVNGKLFADALPIAGFDATMRRMLLDACRLDWGLISPAIFGSLFQSVMDAEKRRNLGAHYTSEANILKLIKPLFLDDLKKEFERVKKSKRKLAQFHERLGTLTFLDPACGCGNFLVITYRELRLLELEVLKALYPDRQTVIDINLLIQVNVDQFFGIECEEFPAQIAQVALWLVDHQMNLRVSELFGMYFARLPLTKSATIVHGNALTIPWESVVPKERLSYILGNPPFIGKNFQTQEQRQDLSTIFDGVKNKMTLDYVTCWYKKATTYMVSFPNVRTAFVSTNSITQGEMVSVLWPHLLQEGIKIHFAHRTFQWNNEARGNAAVHCVIIGFGLQDIKNKVIFEYDTPKSEPHRVIASNINPYLVEGRNITIAKRTSPLCDVAKMTRGSQPTDGGNLLLDESEREELLLLEPCAAKWLRPFSMGADFIKGVKRWCIWLKDCPPNELKQLPAVLQRVERVRNMRLESSKNSTRDWAKRPTLFTEDRQPDSDYLVVPRVSSERRNYIPIGFLHPNHIAGDKLQIIPNATLYHFGILSSTMHMAWMRYVAGRLKNDYSYSSTIVYNNFPWPENITDKQQKRVESLAQAVLDARAEFPESTLADLYDPLTMPAVLIKAHEKLDRAVDKCYRSQPFTDEMNRMQFLFSLYEMLCSN